PSPVAADTHPPAQTVPPVAASVVAFFFFSRRRRHTRLVSDWSSDVCSSDLWSVRAQGSRQAQCPPALPPFRPAWSDVKANAGDLSSQSSRFLRFSGSNQPDLRLDGVTLPETNEEPTFACCWAATSLNSAEAANFGCDEHVEHDGRYDRADEFMEVVLGHWNTWEDDALILDK